MKDFLIALQFLTILPVKIKFKLKPEDFSAALSYFPAVGALIGMVLALLFASLSFMPQLVVAGLILISLIIITGGMHLDGFADTCDGLYGVRTKEQRLKLMRDSRLGAMGAIGLVTILLLKFSLLAVLWSVMFWKYLILMVVFGRWMQVVACFVSKYARQQGKAKYFIAGTGKKQLLLGFITTFGLFLLLVPREGVSLFFMAMLPALLFIKYIQKKLDGGMTGDTIGAVSEFAEVVFLLLCLVQPQIRGW